MTNFGLLTALAFILSYVESILPLQLPVPGMKLGLANIVVVTALYCWGEKEALALSAIRILLVSLTFGNMAAMMYSFAGGMLSLAMMILIKKTAMLILETEQILYYLPVLIISGVVTGALIGIAGGELIKRIKKWTV